MVLSIQSAMVSPFCDWAISKIWFLEIVQVTMKDVPFDAI